MRAIVTVKLSRNPKHDTRNKKTGQCPLDINVYCTDVTGSHHSYIETGRCLAEIYQKAREKYNHITRIEIIERKNEGK